MSNKTKLICLFLKAQKTDKSSEQGYSMAMVSIITIILFSLMVAATILSNMAKARTNAFVDSNSAFYVAEAGLNKRAAEINKILKSYAGVQTVAASPTNIGDCFQFGIPVGGRGESTRSGTNDLECVNYRFQSSNNIAKAISGKDIVLNSGGQDNNTYVAYTLVADRTIRDAGGNPPFAVIQPGEPFAGLNATSYTYQVSSVGKKPVALPNTDGAATATAARESSNNVTLSMTFVNRVVPLFQFGIFYDGDLELNSTSNMQINGWVHSNANMYLLPSGILGVDPITTFMANVSAVGSIYNRVDAWTNSPDNTVNPTTTTGISRLRLSTGPDVYQDIPAYSASTDPLSPAQINAFNGVLRDGAAGATRLTVPSPSFGRKRNYLLSASAAASDRKAAIAESFAKADMRLEMVPDRDVTSRVASPWTRDQRRIPFNFTAITTGGGGAGACTTATPAANSDPLATYVDPERESYSNLRCNVFNKGLLQSLRQPVMVLTNINQNRTNGTTTTAQFRALERQTLGAPLTPTPPTLSVGANTDAVKARIMRALQVAIASTPTPVTLDNLADAFRGSAGGTYDSGDLLTCRTTFEILIGNITELTPADITSLRNSSPNQIAALRNAWFLPAPIQRVEPSNLTDAKNTNTNAADLTANNRRSSGFYDGREQRWMTMLQTNIASLAVWNRDGLYVPADGIDLTTAYSPAANAVVDTFALGTGTTNNTAGLAFDRVTTFTNAGGEIYPVGSLQYLGLGASDTTEGGLVFHATVNDDLNGNGTIDANDINFDNTIPIQARNDSGNLVTVDYVRTYPNQTNARQSPFGFAFNGGNYLPGPLTLASDQAIYVQGNYNNNDTTPDPTAATAPNANRLPAAILADTITVLSNQCVNDGIAPNPLLVPIGQLTCGLPPTINGNPQNYNNVGSALAINAAFLSNTQVSTGNLGTPTALVSPSTYSGGANNYIRLLENWYGGGTPYALNYYGSLVSLNQPIENSGLYRAGGLSVSGLPAYYDVPLRNVNFDQNFLNNTLLPPLTPKASYVRQSSFSRTY